MLDFSEIRKIDGAVADAIVAELERQQHNIELIASENIVSKAVMYTMGTPLTNKYAEGYPAKRYYGGCEKVDIVENLAKERAKELLARPCKCTASQRLSGKPGSILCHAGTRGYGYGYESGSWWSSDSWQSCKYVRQILQFCALWCEP